MLLVSRDQTAFAALQGTTPPVLVAPPAALFGRPTPIPQPHAAAPATRPRLMLTPIDAPGALETSPASPTIQAAPTTTLTPIQTAPLAPVVTGADTVMLKLLKPPKPLK